MSFVFLPTKISHFKCAAGLAIREQFAHRFDVRIQAIISFGKGVIAVLFFAASAMNHLYLRTPENHISGIALVRGYPLKP